MKSYLLRLWYAPRGEAVIVDEFTQRADSPEDAADAVAKSVGLIPRAWGMFTTGEPSSRVDRQWAIEVES